MSQFPRLFSPLALRGHEIRNRILSTGHQTYLSEKGLPSAGFIAYHEARARGGAGLIVTEAATTAFRPFASWLRRSTATAPRSSASCPIPGAVRGA
jgi:2,4-dienoyl-CoA reductase-like NADH-dependent reductase (Old Yellow Enzyme family)